MTKKKRFNNNDNSSSCRTNRMKMQSSTRFSLTVWSYI